MGWLVRLLYNILLPPLCLLVAPAWIVRMAQRGGLGVRLWERLGCYTRDAEFEPVRGIYVHAVSVGEVLIALKLIRHWLGRDPNQRFVLAATTATGFRLAEEQAPEEVRVIYSPVDFPILIGRLFKRFEPLGVVLVDSELWPNLLHLADKHGIPVALVNARLSPRSAGRYKTFGAVTRPVMSLLKLVCAQAAEHAVTWRELGVRDDRVKLTGSVKFDPEGAVKPARREEFDAMLKTFGAGRPVVLAASTHGGEELHVAQAVRKNPGALAVLLPRHAERGGAVKADLERAGFEVVLRSAFAPPSDPSRAVLVVDSTGELRDWTAHAEVVVIGKSLLAHGGQNPTEAIAAKVPVICGTHMQNFEPLITQLREAEAVRTVADEAELAVAMAEILGNVKERSAMVSSASAILEDHRGATKRTVDFVSELFRSEP